MMNGMETRRPPTDSIRLEIGPAGDEVGGSELLVHVNGVELTSRAAGMGMDPFVVLIPDNRLVAGTEPRVVPIARCGCGIYGCGSTDVRIVRDGDRVHWDWLLEVPLDHGVTFPADEYDAEVARIHADRSWQRPQDTARRLVVEGADRTALAAAGLTVSWAEIDYRDATMFRVALYAAVRGGDYQVFLRVPWRDRTPAAVADEILRILATPPADWPATYHSTVPRRTGPPPMAGRGWRREIV
jgi:hypothetical protein